jgi:hypothetical protein
MRALIALACLAALTPAPAHAAGSVTFAGTFQYNAAYGYEGVTGTLLAAGSSNGTVDVHGTVYEAPGLCPPVASTISGTFEGAFHATFTWTRIGAVALVTTRGDLDGDGVGAAAFTQPVNPCFEFATLTVAFSVAG